MKYIKKALVGLAALVMLILLFFILVPILFDDKIAAGVKALAKRSLKTELTFSSMDVSFFSNFPHLTVGLTDFSLLSSAPFSKDTLISAREVSLGVDLLSLFGKTMRISRVYLDQASVSLKYDASGGSSFDVYIAGDSAAPADTLPGNSELQIEYIRFTNSRIHYSDPAIPVRVDLRGINYKGKSHLSSDILRLSSEVQVDAFDLWYDGRHLIADKPLEAKLATRINTRSLNITFEKNDLRIKEVPVSFQGNFNFLAGGYAASFNLFSIYNSELFSISLRLHSDKDLWISAQANTKMDLAKWSAAMGIDRVELRGMLELNLEASGYYASGPNPDKSKKDTVLLSIPKFDLTAYLDQGYFKLPELPQPLTNIGFTLESSCPDHNYRNIQLGIKDISARFLKNRIEGSFNLKGLDGLPMEARLSTEVNLAELKQVFPIDSIEMKGMLKIDASVNGNFDPDRKLFPVSDVKLSLQDGWLKTTYSPEPIEEIMVEALVTNTTGKLGGTGITLTPLAFRFMKHPFRVDARLSNPDDLAYDLKAKGTLDLGKIYHLLSGKNMELDGHIEANLSLQGSQGDALAGRYDLLKNSGTLLLRNIGYRSEYLPLKTIIRNGQFRFDNDRVWFSRFDATYGTSDMAMNGYLENVVNYALSGKKLKGNFTFTSKRFVADEFITETPPGLSTAVQKNPTEGVIVIPDNLEVRLTTSINDLTYGQLKITGFKAATEFRDGLLLLKGMNFDLIGCKVNMDATYGSNTTEKAFFDFHVTASDFDVKRAYNEVPLFRTMASSAASAEGIISIDYTLKGKLNAGMMPVYPSLEGGGTISLKKVKVKGLKLFTAVSKGTEKEKLADPNLSKVELKTTIKNNVITLEQTKMRVSGFRLKMSGTTNFNGQLNLKMRIGLPPLGIVGIPLKIVGNSSDPKIKYGRGNNDQDVEATGYTDEMPPDMKERLKHAKEEDLQEEPEDK